jgi:hypothetical protein
MRLRAVVSVVIAGLLSGGAVASATRRSVGAPFAGSWGAHETSLIITRAGTGHENYADLRRCPNCSFATAPRGTITFTLTSGTRRTATGHVTATSNPRNAAKGTRVRVKLVAGSPGHLLQLRIGTNEQTFCNQTSANQCGA